MPYPSDSTELEIQNRISNECEKMQRWDAGNPMGFPLISAAYQLSQAGQSELQKRILDQLKQEVTKLREITDSYSKSSTRMTWISLIIGFIAVVLTAVSAFYAYRANSIAVPMSPLLLGGSRSNGPFLNPSTSIT